MEEKLECAARVTVRSAAARSIKSYKGGDAVLSGNKGENDLHFWDQSIAHYRALPVRRPASPRRRGMDWSTGASNSGSVIEELVYIGMRAELPATTYTRATGATRGALSYCIHSFIESFRFSLSPLSICLRKFEYSKKIVHSKQTEHWQDWHQWRRFFTDQEISVRHSFKIVQCLCELINTKGAPMHIVTVSRELISAIHSIVL